MQDEKEKKVGIPQSPTKPETHVSPIWEIYSIKGNADKRESRVWLPKRVCRLFETPENTIQNAHFFCFC
jgi:hypothetical protein